VLVEKLKECGWKEPRQPIREAMLYCCGITAPAPNVSVAFLWQASAQCACSSRVFDGPAIIETRAQLRDASEALVGLGQGRADCHRSKYILHHTVTIPVTGTGTYVLSRSHHHRLTGIWGNAQAMPQRSWQQRRLCISANEECDDALAHNTLYIASRAAFRAAHAWQSVAKALQSHLLPQMPC
jgi:hypothetical protein